MAPLLYHHLKHARIELFLPIQRTLQGLYLRHRRANRIRTDLLRQILVACDAAEVPVLVLKGAALAQLVYPDPALRPMSDLDLLVRPADAPRAQSVLARLGFQTPAPADQSLRHRHLAPAVRSVEGLQIPVEIHYRLSSTYLDNLIAYAQARFRIRMAPSRRDWDLFDRLFERSTAFTLGDITARTMGPQDMLPYLCQHLLSHVNVWDLARLIWMADLVSYAEQFAEEIDWDLVRSRAPEVLGTLSLLHFLTPLSKTLLDQAGLKIGRAPRQIGADFQGWPRTRRKHWSGEGFWHIIRETLLPSDWWLRLRYGVSGERSLFWYRWVRHPLHMLGQVIRAGLERIGWPTPFELAGQRLPLDHDQER